jgi:hypothetical protein
MKIIPVGIDNFGKEASETLNIGNPWGTELGRNFLFVLCSFALWKFLTQYMRNI